MPMVMACVEGVAFAMRVCSESATTRVRDANGVPGYRLKASAVRWVGGDGTKGADDPLRRRLESEAVARVNPFFRDLYRDLARGYAGMIAGGVFKPGDVIRLKDPPTTK